VAVLPLRNHRCGVRPRTRCSVLRPDRQHAGAADRGAAGRPRGVVVLRQRPRERHVRRSPEQRMAAALPALGNPHRRRRHAAPVPHRCRVAQRSHQSAARRGHGLHRPPRLREPPSARSCAAGRVRRRLPASDLPDVHAERGGEGSNLAQVAREAAGADRREVRQAGTDRVRGCLHHRRRAVSRVVQPPDCSAHRRRVQYHPLPDGELDRRQVRRGRGW